MAKAIFSMGLVYLGFACFAESYFVGPQPKRAPVGDTVADSMQIMLYAARINPVKNGSRVFSASKRRVF